MEAVSPSLTSSCKAATCLVGNSATTVEAVIPSLTSSCTHRRTREAHGSRSALKLQPTLFLAGTSGTTSRWLGSLTATNTHRRRMFSFLL